MQDGLIVTQDTLIVTPSYSRWMLEDDHELTQEEIDEKMAKFKEDLEKAKKAAELMTQEETDKTIAEFKEDLEKKKKAAEPKDSMPIDDVRLEEIRLADARKTCMNGIAMLTLTFYHREISPLSMHKIFDFKSRKEYFSTSTLVAIEMVTIANEGMAANTPEFIQHIRERLDSEEARVLKAAIYDIGKHRRKNGMSKDVIKKFEQACRDCDDVKEFHRQDRDIEKDSQFPSTIQATVFQFARMWKMFDEDAKHNYSSMGELRKKYEDKAKDRVMKAKEKSDQMAKQNYVESEEFKTLRREQIAKSVAQARRKQEECDKICEGLEVKDLKRERLEKECEELRKKVVEAEERRTRALEVQKEATRNFHKQAVESKKIREAVQKKQRDEEAREKAVAAVIKKTVSAAVESVVSAAAAATAAKKRAGEQAFQEVYNANRAAAQRRSAALKERERLAAVEERAERRQREEKRVVKADPKPRVVEAKPVVQKQLPISATPVKAPVTIVLVKRAPPLAKAAAAKPAAPPVPVVIENKQLTKSLRRIRCGVAARVLQTATRSWLLRKSVEPSTEEHLCAICMDRPKNAVALGCGHLAICMHCSASLEFCAMCRAPSAFLQVFM